MAGISERSRRFVMEITTQGTSPEDAAKLAGIPETSIPALMNNPAVVREINIALESQGLDRIYFASKLKELCEAVDGKGNPVWAARGKGLDMLKDIYGYEAPKQVQQTTTVVTYEERLLMLANDEAVVNLDTMKEIAHAASEV